MRPLVFCSVLVAFGLSALACDELNRPMPVPRSEPRRGCFSDVECPSNLKCWKGPQDIQGICEPREGLPAESGDGGGGGTGPRQGPAPSPAPPRAPDAGPAPVPPHAAPAPGDVSI